MGIESTGNKVFGARTNGAATTKSDDRPAAQFWMNIGYSIDVPNAVTGENETQFIALPGGIPLDTQERKPVNKGTANFVAKNTARNELLDDVLKVCKTMQPCEDRIIGDMGDLQIQLHRVKAEAEVVQSSDNPFRRKLSLVA